MLWYKAWLETRSRFLLCLLGMAGFSSFIVYHGDQGGLPDTKVTYYYFVLHSGHIALCTMWIMAVTLLMMGGLLREKAVGTASFTLSLPVSRARLMSVRIYMGALQSMALAIIPWSAMFVTASVTGKTHSFSQAWYHVVLLVAGGLVFFGMALLISSLVEGEYTAPVVSFGAVVGMSIVLGDGYLRTLSPYAFINGIEYYDRHTGLLTGPIPWGHIAANCAAAALLIGTSVKVMQRREF
jgi:ABC-2 type transport system permease protein